MAVLLAACGGKADALSGAVLDQPYVVPATALTDTDGASYSLTDSTDRRLTLVFFGYTNCPDICTVVMSTLASAMSAGEVPPVQTRSPVPSWTATTTVEWSTA